MAATEGAARATVLRITQTEPSHGFVARQTLVDGSALHVVERPGDSVAAHTRDQKVQGREGAEGKAHSVVTESGRVRDEHQFKANDEAQKIFVAREMMREDIKREFLAGPRKFDEIMEKLRIIAN